MTSQRMNPRAMSEWMVSAASSAVWPRRSVHARVSLSPAVKKLMRSSAANSRRTTSSSADAAPSRKASASSGPARRARPRAWQVDPRRPVDDHDQRLRRQRLELGRQSARKADSGSLGVEVGDQLLELVHLRRELRIARLRLLRDPLEPSLDVLAVGHEQLEAERDEIVVRIGVRREPVEDEQERVDLAQVAEQRGARCRERRRRARRPASPCAPTTTAATCARAARRRSAPCPRSAWPTSPRAPRSLPARVSALKSVVFPAFGSPTMPTSSDTGSDSRVSGQQAHLGGERRV